MKKKLKTYYDHYGRMWMERIDGKWAVYDDNTGQTKISDTPPLNVAFDEDELPKI